MPPSAFLRELAAAGLTLEAEPAAKVEIVVGSRTLILTAAPWSARVVHAERLTLKMDAAPPETAEHDDLIAEIDQLSRYAAASTVPTVGDRACLRTVTALGGEDDGAAWGFLTCAAARRRAARAHEIGHGDLLHDLAEDVSQFAAVVVRHHLSPNPESRREVERCGVAAAVQIVAIMRRVTA